MADAERLRADAKVVNDLLRIPLDHKAGHVCAYCPSTTSLARDHVLELQLLANILTFSGYQLDLNVREFGRFAQIASDPNVNFQTLCTTCNARKREFVKFLIGKVEFQDHFVATFEDTFDPFMDCYDKMIKAFRNDPILRRLGDKRQGFHKFVKREILVYFGVI